MTITETQYTDKELAAIRAEYAKGATDTQFTNFMRECRERNLLPGKHLYFQLRTAKEYDPDLRATEFVKRAIHLTSIDAFRLIALRSNEYAGQGRPRWIYLQDGLPTLEYNIPLEEKTPYAAIVPVYRRGFTVPMEIPARFEAYAVYYKKGDSWVLNDMWKRRGPEQLAKCSEAQNLRAAFPEELGKLYIPEELGGEFDEDRGAVIDEAPTEIVKAPTVAPAFTNCPPSIDHTPAEGKDEPRPGEKTVYDPYPTKDERREFVKRMHVYSRDILPKMGLTDAPEVLKSFIEVSTGISNPMALTRDHWTQVLNTLDHAVAEGRLMAILGGEKEMTANG